MTVIARETLSFFFTFFQRESGLVLDESKTYLIESRLDPLVRAEGLSSIDELRKRIQQETSPVLKKKVIEAMTTNETSFFRDITPFTVLKTTVIPEVVKANQKSRRLRIWSVACSTGQEPYSLAMVVAELAPELQGWDVRILGTDIADKVLDRAQAGVYTQHEVQRGLSVAYLMRFFAQQGDEWAVKPEVKHFVQFRQFNLLTDFSSLGTFDVIFLRNVLIYFDNATKKQILDRMGHALSPGGTLFLGGTETPIGITDQWVRVKLDQGICYKKQRSA
ncbi:MAG: protein-glutamate O-methyltransferase CheR [Nitrospirae bacterium]|nr:protein-glutamate O-methyltransferase CheR [Nitrospirota bacterium]